ncbi:MAG TPA: HipA family kinase [Steroidobacteraceae bacterium]|nr:HipA family kinase [Steroidobacteraceae bacterium]
MKLRTVSATRYVTPLREGGSLPAIVEADDAGMYVLKFRGAGQGPKVLVAEIIVGELARAAGLDMPEIVFIELDADLARTEPDAEIQQLIRDSAGLNLGFDYLPGSVTFDPVADELDASQASRIVWLDAFASNVDRTGRNANMLMWHGKLWLIDHGAALYFHHGWAQDPERADRASSAFPAIKDHILLKFADALEEADTAMSALLTPALIRDVVAMVPDSWLTSDRAFASPALAREAYVQHLTLRLGAPRAFLEEARRARAALV